MKHRLSLMTGAVLALALSGCVTINIYFPAAAAEQAADKIIDQVLQSSKGAATPTPAPQAK